MRRAVVFGIIAGGLQSLLWFPFWLLVPAAFLVVGAGMAGRAWRARLLAPLGPWAVSLLVAGVVVAAAVAAPVKYVDEHRVLLDAGCTSVKQVASAMGARLGEGAELEGEVCFDAPNPTQRRVTSALGERGIGVKQYQCGTGATLLFGTHPIGPPVLFTKPP